MIGYAAPIEIAKAREPAPSEQREPAVIVTDLIATCTDSLTTWGSPEPRTVMPEAKPTAAVADTNQTKPKSTQIVPLYSVAGSSKLPFIVTAIVVLVCTGTATYLWLGPSSTPTSTATLAPPPTPAPVPAHVATAPAAKITPAPVAHPAAPAPAPAPAALSHGSCSIRVDANAAGSIVMVDGRAVGAAPIQVDGLFCGHRTHVAVADPSLAPWERTIIPEEGTVVQVHASLGRLTTAIAVTSTPSGATVLVNGRDVGVTPAAIPVVVGITAKVSVSSPGYAAYEQTIVPRAGASTTIAATLVAQAPRPR